MLRVLIASPGDARAERQIAQELAHEFNLAWAGWMATRLEPILWENYAFPAAGRDTQAVVNEQLGEYEILLGIIRERIGTQTPRHMSGTVEEFERALESWEKTGTPEIMFYVYDIVVDDPGVVAFRDRLQRTVLYWSYPNEKAFEQACRIHLARQVQRYCSRMRSPTLANARKPEVLSLALLVNRASELEAKTIAGAARFNEAAGAFVGALADCDTGIRRGTAHLKNAHRPGFRRDRETRKAYLEVEAALEALAGSARQVRPAMEEGFAMAIGSVGSLLGLYAPLPERSPEIESGAHQIRAQVVLQEKVAAARSELQSMSALLDSNAFSGAADAARRRALEQLEALDFDLSVDLRLARELRRTAEAFLGSSTS
jgi:hypothetical protein